MKRPGIINMKKLRNIPEKSCHDLKKIHKILEKVKDFMFRFARTPLNDIQYNWAVDGLLFFVFCVEIWILTEA